jgi:hypothetical protein
LLLALVALKDKIIELLVARKVSENME